MLKFKQFVVCKDEFYSKKIGRVIEKGNTKYLVRFRIGLFRVVDAWIEAYDLKALNPWRRK